MSLPEAQGYGFVFPFDVSAEQRPLISIEDFFFGVDERFVDSVEIVQVIWQEID